MRITSIAWIMLGTVITLFTLTGVCVVLLNESESRESLAIKRQAELKQLGIDLADASNYLTNEVRNYVQFGERVHYDNFWREVRETRTRDRVVQRLRELGAPQAEIEFIELAKRNSDALIAVEEAAMAAVEEGEYDIARHLVFDQKYAAHKKSILGPISRFQEVMNGRARRESESALARAELMLVLSNILILLSAFSTTALIYFVLIRRTVQPVTSLTGTMRKLADGDTAIDIPEASYKDEIADMVSAVKVFRENAIERGRLEAERAERTAELDRKNQQLGAALKQLEDELEIAKQMQLSILPAQYPDRKDIVAFGEMVAAREVGGDFYDIIEIDRNRIGFVIADVSGKGVPAALLMAVSCTIMKSTALRGGGPGEVLEKVNQVLSQENESSMFVTLFYGIIDIRRDELTYANAGHNPPYLIEADNSVSPLEGTGGVALGALSGMRYAEKSVALCEGDTVFCYTDGVVEAMDPEGREFTDERLRKVLYESYGLSVEALSKRVLDNVSEFADTADQFDDITCVVFRYQPSTKQAGHEMRDIVTARFRNDLQELERMTDIVEAFFTRTALSPSLGYQVTLVLEELLTNVISHGYEDDAEHMIELTINLDDGSLTIEWADDGKAFDPFEVREPDLESPVEDRPIGGMGVHFVKTIMDTLAYRRRGGRNHLTMSKNLG